MVSSIGQSAGKVGWGQREMTPRGPIAGDGCVEDFFIDGVKAPHELAKDIHTIPPGALVAFATAAAKAPDGVVRNLRTFEDVAQRFTVSADGRNRPELNLETVRPFGNHRISVSFDQSTGAIDMNTMVEEWNISPPAAAAVAPAAPKSAPAAPAAPVPPPPGPAYPRYPDAIPPWLGLTTLKRQCMSAPNPGFPVEHLVAYDAQGNQVVLFEAPAGNGEPAQVRARFYAGGAFKGEAPLSRKDFMTLQLGIESRSPEDAASFHFMNRLNDVTWPHGSEDSLTRGEMAQCSRAAGIEWASGDADAPLAQIGGHTMTHGEFAGLARNALTETLPGLKGAPFSVAVSVASPMSTAGNVTHRVAAYFREHEASLRQECREAGMQVRRDPYGWLVPVEDSGRPSLGSYLMNPADKSVLPAAIDSTRQGLQASRRAYERLQLQTPPAELVQYHEALIKAEHDSELTGHLVLRILQHCQKGTECRNPAEFQRFAQTVGLHKDIQLLTVRAQAAVEARDRMNAWRGQLVQQYGVTPGQWAKG